MRIYGTRARDSRACKDELLLIDLHIITLPSASPHDLSTLLAIVPLLIIKSCIDCIPGRNEWTWHLKRAWGIDNGARGWGEDARFCIDIFTALNEEKSPKAGDALSDTAGDPQENNWGRRQWRLLELLIKNAFRSVHSSAKSTSLAPCNFTRTKGTERSWQHAQRLERFTPPRITNFAQWCATTKSDR